MKIDGNNNDLDGFERYSRRFQNGVEILEHDTVRTIIVEDGAYKNHSTPRLVVSDAVSRSRKFIAKSRSQLSEVDTLLRNIMRRPANAK